MMKIIIKQDTRENSHFGHCTHILPKVVMQMYTRFNLGKAITFTKHCNYGIAAKLYTLETWFVSDI